MNNKRLILLPIFGIASILIGFIYLSIQLHELNNRKEELRNEISALEIQKLRLLHSLKETEQTIAIQDTIIAESTDENTVALGAELKNKTKLPSSEFFIVTRPENSNSTQALKYERDGFNFLLAKDVEQAIKAFKISENSYNGYHQVYEISRYLEKNSSNLSDTQSTHWDDVYKTLLQDYNWNMPKEFKEAVIRD